MTGDRKPYHHGNLAEALIAATIQVIEERGAEQLSLREVAKRAGVSPGAPFRHFESKTQLLTAVAEQAMERLAKAVEQAQDPRGDADPLDQLERIGQGYLDWASANPTHFQIVSSRTLIDFDGSDRARGLNDLIRVRMVHLLTLARDKGQLAPGAEVEVTLLSARAFVYGLARMIADGHFSEWMPGGDPLDWARRALADFVQRLRPMPLPDG